MNRNGQVGTGAIIMIAITAIVGAILMTSVAQYVGDVTNTVDVANDTLASANGTTLAAIPALSGKRVTDVVVYNGTNEFIITSGNYTLFQNQVRNGVETALINVTASATGGIQNQAWNISYTYEPTTYDSSSGGRAVAGLIIVFMALAIAVAVLFPTLRSELLRNMRS